MLYRSNRQNRSRGFTLFEMLVVVGIMVIVTGVVLANFPGFRNKSNLDLVAQEVAVAIRQAQTYGIATREKGGTFDSYGVNFVNNNSTRFIIFADKSTSGTQNKYDSGELVEQFDFKGGIKLASNGLKFCGNSGCTDFAGNPQAGVNIMFYRPDPERKKVPKSERTGFADTKGYFYCKENMAQGKPFSSIWFVPLRWRKSSSPPMPT